MSWLDKIDPEIAEMIDTEFVCGSDEVGFGSWAGPLVVCAAVVPKTWTAAGVTDSKKLTAAARDRAYEMLTDTVTYGIVEIPPAEIDKNGVSEAWEFAHGRAIQIALDQHREKGHPELPFVIIDGSRGLLGAVPLPKADLLVPAVSAASIIAKVHRDRIMEALGKEHPGYGWDSNSGYGTPQHQEGLRRLGVTEHHRRTYAPIKALLQPKSAEPNLMTLLEGLD